MPGSEHKNIARMRSVRAMKEKRRQEAEAEETKKQAAILLRELNIQGRARRHGI